MNLDEFFGKYNKVALAFSGGVDSAYLLYAAVKAGADVKAYYVKSAFQPEFEFNDAKKLYNYFKDNNIDCYTVFSGSKGIHLYLFFVVVDFVYGRISHKFSCVKFFYHLLIFL